MMGSGWKLIKHRMKRENEVSKLHRKWYDNETLGKFRDADSVILVKECS